MVLFARWCKRGVDGDDGWSSVAVQKSRRRSANVHQRASERSKISDGTDDGDARLTVKLSKNFTFDFTFTCNAHSLESIYRCPTISLCCCWWTQQLHTLKDQDSIRIIILLRLTTIYIQFGGDHINITEEDLILLGRFFAIPDNSLIYAPLVPQIDRKQGDADDGWWGN